MVFVKRFASLFGLGFGVYIAIAPISCAIAQTVTIPDNYVINVGDEIEVDILDDNDPPQIYSVGRDGAVQLPYIGGVDVAAITVGEARELVRRTYVDEEIFVDPSVELSVAGFRPIAVLGDVRTPGNFEFQPFLTAEQAVGLAGGAAISANNEEARVLERRTLEASLTNLEYDLALSAARYARVQAQLAGAEELSWADVPPDLRGDVSRELFTEHKLEEDRIIALERRDSVTRRELLVGAIAEAETRIELLSQRVEVQSELLVGEQEELVRTREVVARGLAPRANEAAAERVASVAEGDLLSLQEQKSAATLQMADLKGALSRFDAEREQALRSDGQSFLSAINRSVADRASIEDRIRLIDQWMNAAVGMQTDILLRYQVRRRNPNGTETVSIHPYDELLPGDVLVVTVIPPEALGEPG